MRAPIAARLADATADRVARNHDQRITELQGIPILQGRLIRGIVLPDGDEVVVSHGLGHRAALFMAIPFQGDFSATSGRLLDITLIRSDKVDVRVSSVLKATGFGGTLTLDVWAV